MVYVQYFLRFAVEIPEPAPALTGLPRQTEGRFRVAHATNAPMLCGFGVETRSSAPVVGDQIPGLATVVSEIRVDDVARARDGTYVAYGTFVLPYAPGRWVDAGVPAPTCVELTATGLEAVDQVMAQLRPLGWTDVPAGRESSTEVEIQTSPSGWTSSTDRPLEFGD